MRVSDAMLGGVLLVFAAVLAAMAQTFPAIPGQQYGAGVFPTAVALGFAACGAVLLVRGVRAGAFPLVSRADWARDRHAALAVLVTILSVVGYILLARPIGFLPVMSVLLLVLFRMLAIGWLVALPLAIVATVVIQQMFARFLLVPLPLGIMPRLPF